jgi:histidine triad (HIT) family protein
MNTCIFCRIIAGQSSGQIVYQDENVTAFRDIHPVAPTHILIIPKKHIASVNELEDADEPLLGHLFTVARLLAEQEGVDQTGYRLIVNTGQHAGQGVFHLHMHLIGGQRVRYPIG